MIADTKFELGFVDGELIICDEILTPDSSRFWPAESWQPGRDAAVVRQAASPRLGRVDGLGQGFDATTGPRRGHRPDPRALHPCVRTDLGAALRRLAGRDCRLKMVFDVHVEIRGLDGIAGPEGRTIERALPALGFGDITTCASLHEDGSGRRPAQAYLPRWSPPPAGRPAGFIGRGGDRDRTRRQWTTHVLDQAALCRSPSRHHSNEGAAPHGRVCLDGL